jgi:GAF domain-containing protein
MSRRSGAGSEAVKPGRGKAVTLKRRNAQKAAPHSKSSLDARDDGEVARLSRELNDALEREAATSNVLQVISSFAGELEPVFRAILANATRICQANFGVLQLHDSGTIRIAAMHNVPKAFAELRQRRPTLHPTPESAIGRAVATKKLVHIPDYSADPAYKHRNPDAVNLVELAGARSLVIVPMLKDDELIGTISIYRQEVRPFTDKQIALVENFAAQAIIAIENARLLNELRKRTDELTESLEQQTATAEVLKVISGSSGELEPVFSSILENATVICHANFGSLTLYEGDYTFRAVAVYGAMEAYAEQRRDEPVIRRGPGTMFGDVVRSKRPVHITDIAENPELAPTLAKLGARTLLIVPMLQEKELAGTINIYRLSVQPFTDEQIELVTSFAAQAVIAIENARLLNELREALEQQTATSDVLKVISSSPGDLQPVFDTMLANATRLCEATHGHVWTFDGEQMHAVAVRGDAQFVKWLQDHNPVRPIPGSAAERIVRGERFVHVTDRHQEPAYGDNETFRALVDTSGIRASLSVALRKGETLLGMINVYRQEVRPFADKQIKLVQDFGSQAVIAIENTRLLTELKQSLEQQTATADVLGIISSFPGELDPVFQSILENATRICAARFGTLWLAEGEGLRAVAVFNAPPGFADIRRGTLIRPSPKSAVGRVLITKQVVQIVDLVADAAYIERDPFRVSLVEVAGARTLVVVPMLKDDALIGALAIYRQEVQAFTEKQIALMQNFAAQAVIAVENSRLLRELRARTDQLAAQSGELATLNQQLEQRVSDQVGEIERMGRLRRFLPPQVADLIVASGTEKQLESHRREITALFCDLRGFTGFSESSDPEDVMALLRDYHAAIGEIIVKYSGTLERYAGDGVMVVFNDPVPVENPALQAVLMALEMRDGIGALTDRWRRLGHDIGFGIGIAHGFATLGTIGFEGRFDYAAIGTVSNVASRLCDEAKPGQILISPRVLMKVEEAVKVEPAGEFTLKGIRRPLAAYNVLAADRAN